jgi:hypothetical protein
MTFSIKDFVTDLDFNRARFFSLTPREKKSLFQRTEAAVGTYKPMLEDYFGVNLGEVKVKPYIMRPLEVISMNQNEIFSEEMAEDNTKLDNFKVALMYAPFLWGLGLPRMTTKCLLDQNDTFAASTGDNIYLSSGQGVRIRLFYERQYGEQFPIEELVVHELGHNLWNKLGGDHITSDQDTPKTFVNYMLWNEGFPCYIQKEIMGQTYSCSTADGLCMPETYEMGMEKVKSIVDELGIETLREVPSRWVEFEEHLVGAR